MSSYLRIAAVIAFMFTSGAALACSGAKMKSADGSQGATASTTSTQQGG